MYTTKSADYPCRYGCISPVLQRITCAAMAFLCAFCLCVDPLRVNALASEAILIGGTVAAFLSACGLVFSNSGLSSDSILQGIYDKFISWNQTVHQIDDVAATFAEVSLYKGYLKISNALSDILSDFANYFSDQDSIIVSGDTNISSNGSPFPVFVRPWTDKVPYPFQMGSIPFGTAFPYLGSDGFTHTLVINDNLHYNIDGVQYYMNGGYFDSSGTSIASYVLCFTPDFSSFWVTYVTVSNYNKYKYGSGSLLSSSSGLFPAFFQDTLIHSGVITSIPSESIQADQDTYISPIAGVSTLDGYAEAVGTALADNTLSATYTNATTAEIDEAIVNAPPTLDDYSLDGLGELLTTRFPFSIPWDVKAVIDMLHTEPVAPSWTFQPLDIAGLPQSVRDKEVTIDFNGEGIELLVQILRWGIVVLYCAGLASATKHLIWTA